MINYEIEDHVLGNRVVLGYIDPSSVSGSDGYKFIPKNAINGTQKQKEQILEYLNKPVILVHVSLEDPSQIVVLSTDRSDLSNEYIPTLFMLQNRMVYGHI